MSDLIADDLLLDRLAGRIDAGSEPVAGLLGALAAHADTPLPSRTGRRRIANKHRYLGAFAALAVAASGAGVAAAVTLPSNGPSQAERARIVEKMDESARSDTPSALLSRLGLPQTSGTTAAKGLVLARTEDGTIVLLPAAVVAARGRAAAAGTNGIPGIAGAPGGPVAHGTGQNTGQTRNGQGGAGGAGGAVVPGGTTAGAGGATTGGAQTGTPPATNSGKKPAVGTKGGKKPTPTPTSTATTDVVVPETTLATATPTNPTSRTRPTSPAKPRATGSESSDGSSASDGSGTTSDGPSGDADGAIGSDSTSGTTGTTGVDGTTGADGSSGATGTEVLVDSVTGTFEGAATSAAGVADALAAPVVPTP